MHSFSASSNKLTRRAFVVGAGAAAAAAALATGLTHTGGAPVAQASDASASSAGKDELIIALPTSTEPDAGFDPLCDWAASEHVHEPLIQSTLIRTDLNLNFENDLATSYECSKDGLTWTFKIRGDVKFTDGEPLTAKDVAFTINGLANSTVTSADLSMVKEAEATDDTTVTITLHKPYNAFLYTLSVIGIVPEHAYGADYGEKPIGSGRYMLEQWDKGQQAIFAANPDYYGEAPKIKRFTVVFMDVDPALAACNAGKLDAAYTVATLAKSVPSGFELLDCKTVDCRCFSLPVLPANSTITVNGTERTVGNDVTCDKAVRQAMSYALDRQLLIDEVLNGYGTPAYSVGDSLPWSSDDMIVEYDLDKAKKILADGGWTDSGDGILQKDGKRLAFDLWYNAADAERQVITEHVAQQMHAVGMDISTRGDSWDLVKQRKYTDPICWGLGSNSPADINALFHSEADMNFASYNSEKADEYIETAQIQLTVDDSLEYWKKVAWDGEDGIAPKGEAPFLFVVNSPHLYFVRQGLKVAEQKLQPHGHGWSVLNNVDQWSWS